MKVKLSVSKDGINFEHFDDIEFSNEKDIVNYAHSALHKMAKKTLKLRITVPLKSLGIIYDAYNQHCEAKWKDAMISLKKDIDIKNEDVKLDDVLVLLISAKNHLIPQHNLSYVRLRSIVLEHCQLEDPNVI